jgi:hypothetical protein
MSIIVIIILIYHRHKPNNVMKPCVIVSHFTFALAKKENWWICDKTKNAWKLLMERHRTNYL